MIFKRVLVVASFAVVVGTFGCTAQTQDTGESGDTSEPLTESCNLSRATILASVGADRAAAIQRGFVWYDAHVQYSQSREHAGYRTDCSGFVSMAWSLGTSFSTADFSTGGGDSSKLASYNSLLPADALVRRANGEGHVVLFVGWNDAAHSAACVLEEEDTALSMQFHARTSASLTASGFHPIRADEYGSTSGASPGTPSTPPSTTPPSAGGAACHSDGDCNPGNDGSGQICSGGSCVPGCHTSAQCPGSTSCNSGSCS